MLVGWLSPRGFREGLVVASFGLIALLNVVKCRMLVRFSAHRLGKEGETTMKRQRRYLMGFVVLETLGAIGSDVAAEALSS
jgi:hypothetical protein